MCDLLCVNYQYIYITTFSELFIFIYSFQLNEYIFEYFFAPEKLNVGISSELLGFWTLVAFLYKEHLA